MKLVQKKYLDKEFTVSEVDLKDLLSNKDLFRTQYDAPFNELFSQIVYSYTKFHLYVYKLYRRELRGYYLAKWIVEKFIHLLKDDLIDENDTFKFPHKEIYLSIKDANEYRKDWKYYVPKLYGKHYKLFIHKKGEPMYARLDKKYYYRMQRIGINNAYV
jgi:hypothetical protein